jgi:eukaryotic-like serine/threonine-protein kinase
MEQLVQQTQVALPDMPRVGEVIAEKYRVEGILGVGGMGVVLGARHVQLGQLVAIKVLSARGDIQRDAVERFLREGRAAAALTCDHVVRIYDVGQLAAGIPFMVMEQLRGKDLSSVISEGGPLSIADAVEYVAQATVAIVEAHEVGIVHRDLKPANLFLTQRSDGTACIKVLDFGISKQLTDADTETLRGALTSTRQVMGSPAYMSPEQVRDAKTVDHRTDIWALGLTLYELLTQHVAFDADTLPAVCAAIAADPPVPVRTWRPTVPEVLESIIMRCLEKTPDQRYPTARALLGALRDFQGKCCEAIASRQVLAPATESSASLEAAMLPHPQEQSNLVESGPRSVDAAPPEPRDATLVSARTPTSGGVWNRADADHGTEADRHRSPKLRRWSMAALLLLSLVLIGAVTVWFVRPRSPTRRETVAQQQLPPPPTLPRTHFVLRIESNPSQALVLEGGNPVGVTPVSITIDRAVVARSVRQFVVHKDGFVDVNIQQGDSPIDLQQIVSLATSPIATEPKPSNRGDTPSSKSHQKPAAKQPFPSASGARGSSAPEIRIKR